MTITKDKNGLAKVAVEFTIGVDLIDRNKISVRSAIKKCFTETIENVESVKYETAMVDLKEQKVKFDLSDLPEGITVEDVAQVRHVLEQFFFMQADETYIDSKKQISIEE